MKIETGDKLIAINPKVLYGYYDSQYNGEILIVSSKKMPKVRNMTGGSNYFTILTTGKKTASGHECRFSVSLDCINKLNFKRQK